MILKVFTSGLYIMFPRRRKKIRDKTQASLYVLLICPKLHIHGTRHNEVPWSQDLSRSLPCPQLFGIWCMKALNSSYSFLSHKMRILIPTHFCMVFVGIIWNKFPLWFMIKTVKLYPYWYNQTAWPLIFYYAQFQGKFLFECNSYVNVLSPV